MSIILKINGEPLDVFTTRSVQKSIEQASGALNFTATSNKVTNFPVKRLANAEATINNIPIMNGFVDKIVVNYDSSSHSIQMQVRDKTSLLIDSSVVVRTFNSPISLVKLTEKVISDIGADIEVINDAGTLKDFTESVSAGVGESIFEFIERYCRKRQVLFTANGEGNVVLTRAATIPIKTKLINQKGNRENNVKSASISYDDSKRYYSYTVYGQSKGFSVSNANQTNQKGGPVFDDTVLDLNPVMSSKRLILQMESSTNIESAKDRATWEANIRRANSFTYSCKVQGFEHLEGLWEINTLVNVIDDYADINSNMLIKTVQYEESNEGTFTNLELTTPDAFTLQATREKRDALINDQGKGFTFG